MIGINRLRDFKLLVIGSFRIVYRSYVNNGLPRVARAIMTYPAGRVRRKLTHWKRSGTMASSARRKDFDLQFNVDTGNDGALSALAEVSSPNWKHGLPYQGADEVAVRLMLEALRIQHEQFVFIDFGSGKGRVLLIAGDYPFHRVIGVEYCESLHETAIRNINTYHNPQRKCLNIESVRADVATFEIPIDPCVVFLYNPFDATILEPLVRRMTESLRSHPRPMYVIYHNAVHADVFRRFGFRELAARVRRAEPTVLLGAPTYISSVVTP